MPKLPPPLPPEHLRDPGDSWVEGPDGKRYWGRFGAAGALVWHPPQGVLLQLRAEWSHNGGTWGIPGGALKAGESAHHAALRESQEEAGVPAQGLETLHTEVFDLGFWSYTTVLFYAADYFEPDSSDYESDDVQWIPLDTVSSLDLHPGFESSWPGLLGIIEKQRHKLG